MVWQYRRQAVASFNRFDTTAGHMVRGPLLVALSVVFMWLYRGVGRQYYFHAESVSKRKKKYSLRSLRRANGTLQRRMHGLFISGYNGQVLSDPDRVAQHWNDDGEPLDEQCSTAVDASNDSDDDDILDVVCCTVSPNARLVYWFFK
ncbi:unnamed protein product [Toxocara canis]|uniref:Transmembrane protein n=1 Tax=Toxocara canis TaxID=6265 RepID=A0A183UE71_TOXCA|nr:unnamed protein product [Toxocara canis]